MSGYFQRLMNRGASADVLIHPLSRLPYAAASESEPLGDRGEFATALRAGRAEGPAAVAAPAPQQEAHAALLPEVSPPRIRTCVLKEGVASLAHKAPSLPVAETALSQQPPVERVEEHQMNEASESFRLMTPHTSVNAVAPFGSPPESEAGRVQVAHPGLKSRPSVRTPKNQLGMSAAPEVHVTIGRIEVTAVTSVPAQRRAAIPRKPAMSLDDYLARRQRREP